MRLAISNIAWDTTEDPEMARLLKACGIDAIDVAPSKYFPNLAVASEREITAVRRWWAEEGIEITGMQSLLFGTTGLNVFGDATSRNATLEHLRAVFRIGRGLGATRLVFGSPKNRDRSGLQDAEVEALAVDFFRRAGDEAQQQGVILCLEPNPPRYGSNFMIDSRETAQVVRSIDHPSIRMQFDTGALTIVGECPNAILDECAELIGHVHASEPDLLPLGDGDTDHFRHGAALRRKLPDHVVSIEMVATKNEPHPDSIGRALAIAVSAYRTA